MASQTSTIISSKFTEQDWIIHIERTIALPDLDAVAQARPSIFHVPESVRIRNRHSFSPQTVALGPYHHWVPDLYRLETLKLAAAKRAHSKFRVSAEFKHFVDEQLAEQLAPDLRACYDAHLPMSDAALAWIMAVDGLFLLDLLYGDLQDEGLTRDVLLLENQIPMILLTEVVLGKFSGNTDGSISPTGRDLISVSVDFCRRVSPLELGLPDPNPEPKHLLDLFYRLLVGAKEKPKVKSEGYSSDEISAEKPGNCVQSLRRRVLAWLRRVVSEEDAAGFIPSASQLRDAGLRFRVVEYGGVSGICFDKRFKTLSLPSFSWKPHCDVALRNLVAYEAAAEPERPILARYADLMNGLLQSAADAEVMEEEGVTVAAAGGGALEVFGRGMGLSNVGGNCSTALDGTIEAVNEFYRENRKVEVWKTAKRYGKRATEIGTFVAALGLLVFFCLQIVLGIFEGGISGVSEMTPAAGIAKMLPGNSGGSYLPESQ
ncbi:unnamed protein product [Linum tenue]|uniref:Uncharacterized protein n=1 Tax=Linum tenue TaxID=586396 RepID=A0AAV0JFE4_9ROSI|nr:unnamed protein product [Linum tenue]